MLLKIAGFVGFLLCVIAGAARYGPSLIDTLSAAGSLSRRESGVLIAALILPVVIALGFMYFSMR